MGKKSESSIELIKFTNNPKSKQVKDYKNTIGTRPPKIAFSTLIDLYYNSFVVQGLTDKISTAILSGFQTKDVSLLNMINSIDHQFLNRNKVLCGNAFFEVIEDGKGKVTELIPVLSDTIEIMQDGDGYIQKSGTDTVFFNAFTPVSERNQKKTIWENSKAQQNELANTGKGCGYNPNLNQIYQFKNISIETKYYGSSYYESVIDQLLLISLIDKYYGNAFDNGLIKAKMFFPAEKGESFTKDEKNVLKEFLKSRVKGINKSYSTVILDRQIGQLDIEHDIDPNLFNEYRKELLKSVSVALNIPFDLLSNDNSNRASSQVSKETFNNYTIYPLQQENIKDFKILFAEGYNVGDLEYMWIDTSDEKEQMEVLTGYKKSGIMTANEVRAKIGLGPVDGGDELVVDSQAQQKDALNEILKKEGGLFYKKLSDIENDLGQYI